MLSILILCGRSPRHLWVANRLCGAARPLAIVQETGTLWSAKKLRRLLRPDNLWRKGSRWLRDRRRYAGGKEARFFFGHETPSPGRADLLVLSKVASRAASVSWAPKIRGLFGGPVVWCSTRIASLARQGDRAVLDVQSGPSRPAFAFSGIADHEAFLRDLSSLGIQVVGDLRFPDHHAYSADDLARISSASRDAGAVQLITTEKDIARLETGKRAHEEFLSTHTVLCARLDLTVLRGEDQLMALLEECLVGGPRV